MYPLLLGKDGEKIYYKTRKDERPKEKKAKLDVAEEKALYNRYLEDLQPDLLVPHIGSIKESEFVLPRTLRKGEDEGLWYYENHLGMLGTLIMLHQLKPKAAVISEFGSELKGFHFELVERLRDALHERQKSEAVPEADLTFVIPGDLTMAYDIENRHFLCHETCEFTDHSRLRCAQAADYEPEWDKDIKGYVPVKKRSTRRTYLFCKGTDPGKDCCMDNRSARWYCEGLAEWALPYHDPAAANDSGE